MTSQSNSLLTSMAARRSVSKVGPETPTDAELSDLLAAVTPVADHKALHPWRLITLRGDDRMRLAVALDAAADTTRGSHKDRDPGKKPVPAKHTKKPFRAELLIAIVASPREHSSVPTWEQHATASGAAHLLELALWSAGWGVMWRTGTLTNAPEVRAAHGLSDSELLMGWLYVGSLDDKTRSAMRKSRRSSLDPQQFLSRMPSELTAPPTN